MMQFSSFDEVIRYAIIQEQNAFERYSDLAFQASDIRIKNIFQQLSYDEIRHKATLLNLLDNGRLNINPINITVPRNLVIYFEAKPQSEMEATFIQAINEEIKAYRLYTEMAANAENEEIKGILFSIAAEEEKHCEIIKFELEERRNDW